MSQLKTKKVMRMVLWIMLWKVIMIHLRMTRRMVLIIQQGILHVKNNVTVNDITTLITIVYMAI